MRENTGTKNSFTGKMIASLVPRVDLEKMMPLTLCVDLTYRCNLKCKHCYFLKSKYRKELSDEEWVKRINGLDRKHNFLLCSWVGGEPFLRKGLLESGVKLFPFNWVATNGTFEIPNWKNTIFLVSLDGTKKHHDWLRGKTYEKIKSNILSSKADIFIAMTVNRRNHKCIEEFVKEWSGTNVKSIGFAFHSPIRSGDRLSIPSKDRDRILERISKLKKEHGDFILMTKRIMELMGSKNYKNVVGGECAVRKTTICLNPEGKIKDPCLFEGIDCNECGCSIPYGVHAFLENDAETVELGSKLIRPRGVKFLKLVKSGLIRQFRL